MKSFKLWVITLILTAGVFAQPAFAQRDVTPEERARIVDALSAIGCNSTREIESIALPNHVLNLF